MIYILSLAVLILIGSIAVYFVRQGKTAEEVEEDFEILE